MFSNYACMRWYNWKLHIKYTIDVHQYVLLSPWKHYQTCVAQNPLRDILRCDTPRCTDHKCHISSITISRTNQVRKAQKCEDSFIATSMWSFHLLLIRWSEFKEIGEDNDLVQDYNKRKGGMRGIRIKT